MWESKLSSITKVRFIMNRIILDCKSPSYNETLFGLSFLTTPNIYKNYFKGRLGLHECGAKSCDELKNFAANIFLKLVIKSRIGIRAPIG